jgi:hypothetical protein
MTSLPTINALNRKPNGFQTARKRISATFLSATKKLRPLWLNKGIAPDSILITFSRNRRTIPFAGRRAIMDFNESVGTTDIQLKRLQGFTLRLAVTLLAFTLGYAFLVRRWFAPSQGTRVSASLNQIPLEGAFAPKLVRPTFPEQVYNRETGQWEVEKPNEASREAEGLPPRTWQIMPIEKE